MYSCTLHHLSVCIIPIFKMSPYGQHLSFVDLSHHDVSDYGEVSRLMSIGNTHRYNVQYDEKYNIILCFLLSSLAYDQLNINTSACT